MKRAGKEKVNKTPRRWGLTFAVGILIMFGMRECTGIIAGIPAIEPADRYRANYQSAPPAPAPAMTTSGGAGDTSNRKTSSTPVPEPEYRPTKTVTVKTADGGEAKVVIPSGKLAPARAVEDLEEDSLDQDEIRRLKLLLEEKENAPVRRSGKR